MFKQLIFNIIFTFIDMATKNYIIFPKLRSLS